MKNNYIKKYSFIIILTLLISAVSANASDISWLNYTDGMAKAKAEGKKVYIHFYADWCHYCKVMAKTTFKDASVITFLNDKFIPIRVDTVKEKKLARDYLVRGLPSNWFLEPDGKRIGMKPGYLKPKQFLENLKFVHEEQYKPKKK